MYNNLVNWHFIPQTSHHKNPKKVLSLCTIFFPVWPKANDLFRFVSLFPGRKEQTTSTFSIKKRRKCNKLTPIQEYRTNSNYEPPSIVASSHSVKKSSIRQSRWCTIQSRQLCRGGIRATPSSSICRVGMCGGWPNWWWLGLLFEGWRSAKLCKNCRMKFRLSGRNPNNSGKSGADEKQCWARDAGIWGIGSTTSISCCQINIEWRMISLALKVLLPLAMMK